MNVTLVVTYYFIVLWGIIAYITTRRKGLTMSDFIIVNITMLYSLSGVFNSYGISEGYNKLDATLYILFAANALLIPIGLIVGKRLKSRRVKPYNSSVSDGLIKILIAFIIVYAAGFFYVIRGNIPLLLLLSGKGAYEVAIARLQVTHNLTAYYSIPFIFRYYSMIFGFLSLYVFSVLFVKYLYNKKKYKRIFWIYFFVVLFLQFYATEKVPLVYVTIIIIYDLYMVKIRYAWSEYLSNVNAVKDEKKKRKTWRRLRGFVIAGVISFFFLYTFFMGIGGINNGIISIINRAFVQQSSSVYLQKLTLDNYYGGCLYGKGVTLTIIDSLIRRTPVNLSKLAYAQQYSAYVKLGGTGAAGSIGIFDLYANYGMPIALIILFVIAVVTGKIDKHMCNTIEKSPCKELPIAYQSMLIYIFFQGYLGHFQAFFQLPFIIAPSLFIIMLMTFIFKHAKLKIN